MKRSEMVFQISDNVISSFFPNLSLKAKNLIADAVLAEVEKLGMSPPFREDYTTKDFYNRVEPYSWEPEHKLKVVK